MSSLVSFVIKSCSAASRSNEPSVSSVIDVLKRFFTIFSLLSARSADELDTGRQQKNAVEHVEIRESRELSCQLKRF